MSSTRFAPSRRRLAAAGALAALIATAGLVAAASGGGSTAGSVAPTAVPSIGVPDPTDATTPAATPATDATTPTTPGAWSTVPTPAAAPESSPSAGGPAPAPAPEPAEDVADEPAGPGVAEPDLDDPGEEPDLPGTPGVVTGPDPVDVPPPPPPGPTEFLNPVDKPGPTAPIVPGPVDLLPAVGGGDPDPTPHAGPSDFQVTPLPSHVGTVTSGLSGCQLECVTNAQLIANAFDPSVVLEVSATVPVHIEAEVTKSGTDSSKLTNGPGYETDWNLHLTPLQPGTTYDLQMIVIDEDGWSKVFQHTFTTVDVIDGFVGNAQGCALHCITEGSIDKTDDHSKVRLHVETDSPARLDVWVSTSEPGTIGGAPVLPLEAKVHENVNPSTSTTFDVTGLRADTTYHVVARAEDDWGVDHQIGTFHTDAAPPVQVTVTFEHIRLTYDGDKWKTNRGEVRFAWGLDGYATGHRAEEKMKDPKNIPLSSHNTEVLLLPADGWSLPWIGVSAGERDWDGLIEFCAVGNGVSDAPTYIADCDIRYNVARTPGPVTQADVAALPECGDLGIGQHPDRKCLFLVSPDEGDDYPRFTAIVSIDAP